MATAFDQCPAEYQADFQALMTTEQADLIVLDKFVNDFYKLLIEKAFSKSKDSLLIFLLGAMGQGKTTLVRSLAKTIGLDQEVTSPTYPLVLTYHSGDINLIHADLYRLEQAAAWRELGLEDYLAAPNHLVCVEWPSEQMWTTMKPDALITLDACQQDSHRKLTGYLSLELANSLAASPADSLADTLGASPKEQV